VSDASVREAGLLGNRYVLEGLIGRGGMADVYRAHDRVLDRSVAVKLMRGVATGETERARFTNEARTLARLRHPGLVTVLDAATTDDEPYLVMELVAGPNLAERCRGTALDPTRVAAIGAQLADALGHAHAAGVVHRDLKPGNVLLGADGRALLTDFGVARLMSETVRHTTAGSAIGTAAYLAPEQVRGEDVSPAADVYALGLVLLEVLTGERAYRGLPVEAALARLTTPPHIPNAVPSPWHGLLRAMTALEPAERPSTDAVAASLRGLAAGLDPTAATAALRTESVRKRASPAAHGRWLIGATAAALLLTLVGASGGTDDGDTAARPANVAHEVEQPPQLHHDAVEAASRPQQERHSRTAHAGPARDGGDRPLEPLGQARREASAGDVEEMRDDIEKHAKKDKRREPSGGPCPACQVAQPFDPWNPEPRIDHVIGAHRRDP
jgi:hypothetical protein